MEAGDEQSSSNENAACHSTRAQARRLKNRMCRETIKKFDQLVARQEEGNGGSELRGHGDSLHRHSLKINLVRACWAIGNNVLIERRKAKDAKGAQCAKDTEDGGQVTVIMGGVDEVGGAAAAKDAAEEGDGNSKMSDKDDVPTPSTYEEDKEFYSSQESFKLHLETKMETKDLVKFLKELKLEWKRLRKAQSSRQKGIHYAHAVAHCSLLGAGGTYSSASHDLKKWKEGPAFYGTSTGSLAQTLAIAKGVKIRFWVCKRYSIEVIAPPEHYSSQECPFCLNCKKGGSERRFVCMKCGLDTHRDLCKATNNQTQRVIAMGMDVLRALLPHLVATIPQSGNTNTLLHMGSEVAV
jgi:hypothetical protein